MREYLKRAGQPSAEADQAIQSAVEDILARVRHEHEAAVRELSTRFDRWDPPRFRVSPDEISRADRQLSETLKQDIAFSQRMVREFATRQLQSLREFEMEITPGVHLGQKLIPVAASGSYVPGGRYPLIASAFMSIITPKVAGVSRVIACSPPQRSEGIHPATLYAMATSGADEIYCLGGVQALAAMAYGISEIAPVDFIVGPGNAYVAEAKRQLFGTVGIDLLAGPTEILIIADETGDPALIATDLLGQAEHDPNSMAVLITTSRGCGSAVIAEVERQLLDLPTRNVARACWQSHGEVIAVNGPDEAIAVADEYAPEHLEVHVADWRYYLEHLRNYGSLFLGEESTVAFADKTVGTNHILPTGRAARYTGGLWVGKFLKVVTYQHLTPEGARAIAPVTAGICGAEGLAAHRLTAEARMRRYGSSGTQHTPQ